MKKQAFAAAAACVAALSASAELIDRAPGIRIGQRMTLRPYVSMSYTYDTNMDSDRSDRSGSTWIVSPAFDLDYSAENWNAVARAWYQYHAYEGYSSQLNSSSYGETISLGWQEPESVGKGWNLMVSERFTQISQDDDMSNHGGRGIGRDRKTFQADGAVGHRFTNNFHMHGYGGYYLLDYDNNVNKYAPLYGWKRLQAGGELGYTVSRWLDFIVSGSYQWYWQDNDRDLTGNWDDTTTRKAKSTSTGWTLHGGVGSYLSERISYRVLAGWSRFDYMKGLSNRDNVTYSVSSHWRVSDTLSVMFLGSSYYQPSEREYASSILASTLSLGVGKSFIRGKVSSTFDLSYRHEECEYSSTAMGNYDEDIITGRLGINYNINRFVGIFGRAEYQTSMTSGGSSSIGNRYDYDRMRGTVGLRLSY